MAEAKDTSEVIQSGNTVANGDIAGRDIHKPTINIGTDVIGRQISVRNLI